MKTPNMETKLWALLIPGPDEVWAMASKEQAEADAERHNAVLAKNNLPEKWGVPAEAVQAQVIEWPYSAEEHAESLMSGEPDILEGDGDPRPETPQRMKSQATAALSLASCGLTGYACGNHYSEKNMNTPICPTHGPMQQVPPGTPEQAWCGEWWRCDRCTHSVLQPSEVLKTKKDERNG